jgi:peptidoglycan/LPS O-acetylase OafA/YrhL
VRKVVLIRLDCILYGVVAAYACRRFAVGRLARVVLAGVGLAVTGYATWLFTSGWVRTSPLWRALFFTGLSSGLAALLPLAATIDARCVPIRLAALTRRLAAWSYALYLTNLPVQRLMILLHVAARTPAASVGATSAYVVASIAWAAAIHRWFERPITDTRERLARRLALDPSGESRHPPTRARMTSL